MGIDAHLIHTCTLQRATTTQDAYHNDVQAWSDDGRTNCRLVVKSQRVLADDRVQFVAVTSHMLILPAGANVQPDDRVTDLTFEDGSRDAGPFRITAVLPRRTRAAHHVTVMLERVT